MYVLAIAAGAANPVQAGANAELRKSIEQPLFAAAIVYVTGLCGVFLIQLFVRQAWPDSARFAAAPWWAWIGGAVSIAATLAGITFAQRMGSGVFTGISVTASLIASLVLDNFGWIGFKVHPISWPRAVGCGLMVGGLWMVGRF